MLDEELLKNTYKQLQLAMKGLPTSISNSSNGDLDFFLLKKKNCNCDLKTIFQSLI